MKLRSRKIEEVEIDQQEQVEENRRMSKRIRNAPAHFHEDFDALYSPKKKLALLNQNKNVEEEEEGKGKKKVVLEEEEEKPNVRRSLRIAKRKEEEEEKEEDKIVVKKGKGGKVMKAAAAAPKKVVAVKAPARRRQRAPAPPRRRRQPARRPQYRRRRPRPVFFPPFGVPAYHAPPEAAPEDFLSILCEEDSLNRKFKFVWPSLFSAVSSTSSSSSSSSSEIVSALDVTVSTSIVNNVVEEIKEDNKSSSSASSSNDLLINKEKEEEEVSNENEKVEKVEEKELGLNEKGKEKVVEEKVVEEKEEVKTEEELKKIQEEEEKKKKLEEVEKNKTVEPITLEKITTNKAHVKLHVPKLHEELPLADISSFQLRDILKDTDIPKEESEKWKSYGGYDLFADKEAIARSLETIMNYAENDPNTSAGLKNKLRLVTKLLMEDLTARPGILCMLASNGNLCNVQKEIGINMAYSLLTENLKEDMEKLSMKNLVLRQLETLRELIIEEMFIASGNYMNSHPLVGYRNGLAPHLGLIHIPDQHTSTNVADKARVVEFFNRYNAQRICNYISVCINDKPKKISYEKTVDWFKENSPMEDSYEFLGEIFDENGLVTPTAILYLLLKLEVLA